LILIDWEHFKYFIPIQAVEIVEMVIGVDVERIQEGSLFGSKGGFILILYSHGVGENGCLDPLERIYLAIHYDIAG
jgi:hypothetical protein